MSVLAFDLKWSLTTQLAHTARGPVSFQGCLHPNSIGALDYINTLSVALCEVWGSEHQSSFLGVKHFITKPSPQPNAFTFLELPPLYSHSQLHLKIIISSATKDTQKQCHAQNLFPQRTISLHPSKQNFHIMFLIFKISHN